MFGGANASDRNNPSDLLRCFSGKTNGASFTSFAPIKPVPPRMTIFVFLFLVSDLDFVLRYRNCVFVLVYSLRFSSFRSIRGSGINQRSAANTYSPAAIHGLTNASGIAAK